MFGLGPMELLLIGGIFMMLFGAKQLPKVARSVSESIVELRRGVRHIGEIEGDVKQLEAEGEERFKDDVRELRR